VTDSHRALALVRRARRQLEALRLLRWGARGALLGAALALLWTLFDKAAAGGSVSLGLGPLALSAGLPFVAALAGLAAAFMRPSIAPVAAALYLDRRCETDERFVTLWSLPRSAHADEWAAALAPVRRLPHLPLPREAGLLPVALFCLFAAGLLPAANGEELAVAGTPVAHAKTAESAGAPAEEQRADPERGERLLRERGVLTAAALEEIERAIEQGFVRPEERVVARAELERARAGDIAARERLGKALLEGAGALGDNAGPNEGVMEKPAAPEKAAGEEGAAHSPYPDAARYLRAYRVEVARLRRARGEQR